MHAQEVHQLAHRALLDELAADFLGAAGRDALDFGQAFGFVRHDLESVLTELFCDACAETRADAANKAGGEVVRDAANGCRKAALKAFRAELFAVGRVHDPEADHGQLLAQTDAGKRAGRGDFRALLRQKAQHSVTVFLVAENDLLDCAAQLYIFFFVHKAPSFPVFAIPDT